MLPGMAILTAATILSALTWAYLVAFHGRFWSTATRLPADPAPPASWPSVAILVPARNEAAVLADTLPALLGQDYPGPARVVLVDDRSDDATAALARSLQPSPEAGPAAGPVAGHRGLVVVDGAERPGGWTGKVWALHQALAAVSDEEYVLATDADILHPPGSLRRLVAMADASGLDTVSLMVRLRAASGWERLVVPAFVYFFALLYPFRRVNRPGGRTAAAAGGCILVRTAALRTAGGYAAIAGAVIDDVALARALKASGARIWLGLADDVASLRAYDRLAELWVMVARTAFCQLRYSALLLAGTVAGLAFAYLVPVAGLAAGLATGAWGLAAAAGVAWGLMATSYAPMLGYYGQPALAALALPFTAALYLAMTVDSARRHWSGAGVPWHGRRVAGR
jgi:hopene-associated glycosyltransferase HpnB